MLIDAIFHELGLAHTILRYLDVVALYKSTSVCRLWNSRILARSSEIGLWGPLCAEKGITNTGATRTRGKRLWKEIYLENVCINCYDTGTDVVGSAGSGSNSVVSSGHELGAQVLTYAHMETKGIVVVDVDGGSSLKRSYQQTLPIGAFGSKIALCSTCLHSVVRVPRHADRQRICLQRLKRRKQGSCMLVWNELISKLPSTLERASGELPGGAKVNDFLLKKIMRSSDTRKAKRAKVE